MLPRAVERVHFHRNSSHDRTSLSPSSNPQRGPLRTARSPRSCPIYTGRDSECRAPYPSRRKRFHATRITVVRCSVFPRQYAAFGNDLWNGARNRARSAASSGVRRESYFASQASRPTRKRCKPTPRASFISTQCRWATYTVTVSQAGFETGEQNVTVLSGTAPILHFELRLAAQNQSVDSVGGFGAGANRIRDAHDADRSRGNPRDAGRIAHKQPGDDYGLHARRLRHARSTAHSRRSSGELADRRRADSEHEHREQPWPADRSERHRHARNATRQLFGAITAIAPTAIFNVAPRTGFETQQRSRTGC